MDMSGITGGGALTIGDTGGSVLNAHRFSYRFCPPNIEGAVRDLLSSALA